MLPELCVTEELATELQHWVRRPNGPRLLVVGSYHHRHRDEVAPLSHRKRNTALVEVVPLVVVGVVYLDMTFIVGKKQDGKTYYYLAESARVGGKPRIVSQRYLGSAEEIAARLSETWPGEPDRTRHLAFGDLAAVWGMLERLGVAEIIDDVVGSRRGDARASVGTYIALAVANRLVDPCSKLAFAKWWATTGASGTRWTPSPTTTSKRSSGAS